jgi:hypothetical protein
MDNLGREAPARRVNDGKREWVVREQDARRVPGAQQDTCLLFVADDVVRRVWRYPSNWYEADEDQLIALATAPSEISAEFGPQSTQS